MLETFKWKKVELKLVASPHFYISPRFIEMTFNIAHDGTNSAARVFAF